MSTISQRPFLTAQISGVIWDWLDFWTEAPRLRSSLTTSVRPWLQAAVSAIIKWIVMSNSNGPLGEWEWLDLWNHAPCYREGSWPSRSGPGYKQWSALQWIVDYRNEFECCEQKIVYNNHRARMRIFQPSTDECIVNSSRGGEWNGMSLDIHSRNIHNFWGGKK